MTSQRAGYPGVGVVRLRVDAALARCAAFPLPDSHCDRSQQSCAAITSSCEEAAAAAGGTASAGVATGAASVTVGID
eukprot:5664427-Pyramimonas_sp.AAC.1